MTPLLFLGAAVAGGVGAALRYLVDIGVTRIARGGFPWGILVVNVTGSFALGLVTAALPDAAFLLGAGLLGGYTTFSTAMLDAVALWLDGQRASSAVNAIGMLALGVVAAGLGLALGAAL
ncbi:CrcB family protein [Microbacterium sp.]|uniref:fluoride efflux transporter FluC n=1 Tax=Microbacterium sp. TaxID=51671 RepID=UPI0028123FFE|nr:CrcB family protein [Microbacterium sp.]